MKPKVMGPGSIIWIQSLIHVTPRSLFDPLPTTPIFIQYHFLAIVDVGLQAQTQDPGLQPPPSQEVSWPPPGLQCSGACLLYLGFKH